MSIIHEFVCIIENFVKSKCINMKNKYVHVQYEY